MSVAQTWSTLALMRDFRRDRLGTLLRLSRQMNDIKSFQFGPRAIVIVNSAAHARAILVEHDDAFQKGPGLRIHTRPVLGNGLLISGGDLHRRQRRLVAPAFRPARIAAYADAMASFAERLQNTWQEGADIDIAAEMYRLTQAITAWTLFGTEIGDEADTVHTELTVTMRDATRRIDALLQLPLEWPTPHNRRVWKAVERLDNVVNRIIAERRAAGVDRGDLLSMLLEARDEDDGSAMSDTQVRDEAMTIYLAGHETTANALAWTFYQLGHHPDVYTRMRQEVDSVLAGRTPSLADLPHLPYTLQILKESMRLYPPAYAIVRQALRDLDLDGYPIQRDAIVLVSTYTMHRRPDYFPDPERFDPERFSAEQEALLPRHAYLPFGAGSRICIGNHFALMEGHLVLAALAQRVRLELVAGSPVRPEPLITLRPRDPIPMIVHRRDFRYESVKAV